MILCVRVSVSAIGQDRVVDQRRVVEALHVELGSVLRRSGERRFRKRERILEVRLKGWIGSAFETEREK